MNRFIIVIVSLSISFSNCSHFDEKKLEKLLLENPQILTETMKKHPVLFMQGFSETAKNAELALKKSYLKNTRKEIQQYLKNPLTVTYEESDILYGKPSAAIELVVFSDFQCSHCAKGHEVIKNLVNQYKKDIKVIFKHLPLEDIHPHARLAAQYFEAIRSLSKEAAQSYFDKVFAEQAKLKKEGEAFLKSIVKSLGLDQKKIESYVKSKATKKAINSDISNARLLGIGGTPAHVINGVLIQGAYPPSFFSQIIKELQKTGRISLGNSDPR